MILGDAARVYLAFLLPGLFATPLLRRAFPALKDGGTSIARPVGWALFTWMAWFPASLHLLPYGTPLGLTALALLIIGGAWVGWKDRGLWRELLRREWRTMALGEAVCLAVFALATWEIQYNGDIHPLAERFMDYAMMERVGLTKVFPPLDSWMAGKTLQYYYYGYVVMDLLRRLAAMELPAFFNLAIPGVFSAFAAALWGAGLSVTGKRIGAAVASVGGALVGNFEFAKEIVAFRMASGRWHFADPSFRPNWFGASRLIDGTINETPVFSAFWGDLHPYYIGFPLVAAALAIAIAAFREKPTPLDPSRPRLDRGIALALLTLPVGALYPTNSWDYPTFLVVTLAALALPHLDRLQALALRLKGPERGRLPGEIAREPVVQALLAVVGLSVLLYLPFHLGFGGQVKRGILLAQNRSDALPMLVHFGPWIGALLLWAIATSRDLPTTLRRVLPIPVAALLLGLYELLVKQHLKAVFASWMAGGGLAHLVGTGLDHLLVKGLAFVLLVTVLWVLIADLEIPEIASPEGTGRALFAGAIALALVCEFAYVRDFYGPPNERMNTVFKAYIQAWILLAAGTSGLAMGALAALAGRDRRLRMGLGAALVPLTLAGLAFPLLADASRSFGCDATGCRTFYQTRSSHPPTYDPLDLFRLSLPADFRAVEWVKANLPPDAIVLEATANAYEWESRIATFTGRRTLIGWKNHESGWRNTWEPALERAAVIDKIYQSDDLGSALELARAWKVDYIYVGELEQDPRKHPGYKLEKFQGLEKAYSNERVALYKVPAAAQAVAAP